MLEKQYMDSEAVAKAAEAMEQMGAAAQVASGPFKATPLARHATRRRKAQAKRAGKKLAATEQKVGLSAREMFEAAQIRRQQVEESGETFQNTMANGSWV